jgi:hypothetical protein
LKDSTVIIDFNSSVVYETIPTNRNLIVPNFNKENKRLKKRLLKVANQKYFANSQNDFYRKLNFYLKSSYKNQKLSNVDITTLDYYLGNIDRTSGKRMNKFLNQVFR